MRRLRLTRRRGVTAALTVAVALGLGLVFGVQAAPAADFHGIAFTKGCDTPVKIGDPYQCAYQILNVVDTAHDTLTISSIVDTVSSAGGAVTSGNLLDLTGATLTFTGGASCDGTKCTLPFGSTISTPFLSHYTVQPADYGLPNHVLTDQASLTWKDTCSSGSPNCPSGDQTASSGSQATVQQLQSNTSTAIHNAAHSPVTVVEAGSVVHDFVTVTGQPGKPNPTGNVNIDWFTNNQCSGSPAASSGPVGPLNASGQLDATGFAQGPLAAGFYGFKAHYLGDGTYATSDGACEPLQVVDANIQITPATATNPVGTNHTLTCHINVNDGTGFTNAPDGTICTVAIVSGPGSPVSQNCTVSGGAGNCQATITSSVTGTSVVQASTDVTVGGLVLHRQTGDAHAGDGPNAQKAWVDANIQITPATATDAVGDNHVLTITVNALGGTIDAGPHTATASIVSGPGTFVGSPTCTYTGGGASASCTVTITSSVTGTTVVQATSNIPVNGVVITRTTGTAQNTASGGSGNASKNWVDANIQITPATATNRIGTNHVLTITVNALGGTIDAGPHTATATIVSGPGTFVGSPTCTYTGGGASASCTVTITSSVTGTTVVSATSNIPVNGVVITRTTGTAVNTASGGSDNASKTWVNAAITIAPSATNEIGHPHTFTATVLEDNGSGLQPVGAGVDCNITLTPSNGANPVPPGPLNTVTDANGQCSITFTSQTPGKVTGNASSTLDIGGQSFTITTDGVAPDSGPAVKTFVDARISITPNGVNRVGQSHTFTGHVQVNDGSGAGYVDAPAGTQISFTIDSGPGSFTTPNPCTVASGGSCQITLTSNVTGVTIVSAHTTLSVGGVSLTRDTNGSGGNSGPATKTWVNAKISIAPNATNEVGAPHTFTVTLMKDNGNGAGFVPAAGEHVDVTLTDSNGASHTAPTGSCTNAGPNTDANGQCTITFTSNSAGKVTGHATSTLSVNGSAPFTVATDGVAPNSGDAVKTFVDANIQITPQTATNPVGTNHTLTGHVNVNDGSGGGFVNAPDGTVINFSLTNSGGASATFVGPSSCTTAGGTGSCTVVISSPTAGTTTINASTTLSVGGVTLTRTTNGTGGNSGPATKLWADDQVATHVRDANGNDITGQTVPGGTVVHDEATVTKTANTPASVPNPTGTVSFTLYGTNGCSGTVVATDPNKALNGSGVATSANFTTPTAGGSFSYKAHYNGDANYPAHDGPCEPFTVQPPVTGQITPTNVSCQDFASGTAPTLSTINYPNNNGKIGQGIDPGVFFYWAKITTTTANQVVIVSQSNTSTNNAALFSVSQGWDRLYTGNCATWTAGTIVGVHASGASFTVPTPGTYFIGIKYDVKSIVGTNVPVPTTITYNFISNLGPSTAASVVLAPK